MCKKYKEQLFPKQHLSALLSPPPCGSDSFPRVESSQRKREGPLLITMMTVQKSRFSLLVWLSLGQEVDVRVVVVLCFAFSHNTMDNLNIVSTSTMEEAMKCSISFFSVFTFLHSVFGKHFCCCLFLDKSFVMNSILW